MIFDLSTAPLNIRKLVQKGLQGYDLYQGQLDGIPGPLTKLGLASFDKAHPEAAVVPGLWAGIPNYALFPTSLSEAQKADMKAFSVTWNGNKPAYERIGRRASVPAELIAALHWREASGSFHRYLHQGDRLGRPAVNVPKNIPVFPDTEQGFEDAAVHALAMKESLRKNLGISSATTDVNILCAYAESYNGYGYKNHGMPSPYVLAGTTGYKSGKYVSDGKLDRNAVDEQLGVLPMLRKAGLV